MWLDEVRDMLSGLEITHAGSDDGCTTTQRTRSQKKEISAWLLSWRSKIKQKDTTDLLRVARPPATHPRFCTTREKNKVQLCQKPMSVVNDSISVACTIKPPPPGAHHRNSVCAPVVAPKKARKWRLQPEKHREKGNKEKTDGRELAEW